MPLKAKPTMAKATRRAREKTHPSILKAPSNLKGKKTTQMTIETSTAENDPKQGDKQGMGTGEKPDASMQIDEPDKNIQPKSLVTQFNKEATIETTPEPTYTYDWNKDGKFPPTALFKTIPQTYIDRATKYTKEKVYPDEEDPETVHDQVRMARSLMVKSADPNFEPAIHDFMDLFQAAHKHKDPLSKTKEGKQVIRLGLRLAKSSPEIFEDCYFPDQGRLLERRDSKAWAAANMAYGSHWSFEIKPSAKPKDTSGTKKKAPLQQAALSFAKATTQGGNTDPNTSDEWKMVQTKRGIFKKKTKPPTSLKHQSAQPDHPRKFQTFLKVRFPQATTAEKADAEAVLAFQNVLTGLTKFDPRMVVYPWIKPWEKNKRSTASPLTKSSASKPESKAKVEQYVDRLFVAAGKFSYVRMQIGHDQPISNLDDTDHNTHTDLRAKGIYLTVEKIQDADIATAGWFMGSHPKSFHCQSFAPVLQSHPRLAKFQIDLQIRAVKPDPKHQWKPSDPWAVHIFCARKNLDSVKRALNSIYGSKSVLEKMPMGRSLRFIPYTADPKGRAPLPDMKRNIHAAIRKQKRFIESTDVIELHGIVDLDYALCTNEQDPMSIREVLQAMKASDFQTNMFLAVDEKWNGEVTLTFHKSLAEQAQLVVSYLPLLLAERFGPRAWGWFDVNTQAELSGFYWDSERNCIASTDQDNVEANLTGFDDFDDLSDETTTMQEDQQIEINIELQFDLEDPPDDSRIVGDENRSVVTFGGVLGHDHMETEDTPPNTQTPAAKPRPQTDPDKPEDVSTITDDLSPSTTTGTTTISTRTPSPSQEPDPSAPESPSGQDE